VFTCTTQNVSKNVVTSKNFGYLSKIAAEQLAGRIATVSRRLWNATQMFCCAMLYVV